MAGLAARNLAVLSDDLLVTDGPTAFPGPRCVDLREPIPGLEAVTVSARLGTRLRMSLPPVPHRLPLGGWVFLHWGPEASLEHCAPDQTLLRLAQWRGRRQPPRDTGVGQAAAPNRSYTVGAPGVLTLRRTVTNTSGRTITAAKLRVTALSEANGAPRPGGGTPPPRQANLRIVNPGTATSQVTVSGGGAVTVQNVSVDAPATTTGGGLNSTLTVPLGGGLAPGAAVNVAVTFAVDTRGTLWFGYDIDATDTAAPIGLGRRLSGLFSPPRPGRSAVPAAGGTVRGNLR